MTSSKRRRADGNARLALHDPVELAWGARLLQLAVARHRRQHADDQHAETARTHRPAPPAAEAERSAD